MKKFLNTLFFFVLSHYTFGQTPGIKQLVETYAAQHQFNGTVLIQKDSK
ncbi:hypothetical protein H7F33_13915 [Pedobacter sp. PAMC26386]|nr:hypothetical protein H7F33_13915 [Pedobacter sp. PAMC26386]